MNINEITGGLSGKVYDADDAIKIISPWQIAFYWKHGIKPLDIFPSTDHRTGEPILVGVFLKSETKEIYDLWMTEVQKKRELRELRESRESGI